MNQYRMTFLALLILAGCGGGGHTLENLIEASELNGIDTALAAKGKVLFETKCMTCHRLETKVIGPALQGVTKRRSPNWIMNMVLYPERMTANDPVAKQLKAEHNDVQMVIPGVTKADARAALEFLRQADS